jgi:hypothetical protein
MLGGSTSRQRNIISTSQGFKQRRRSSANDGVQLQTEVVEPVGVCSRGKQRTNAIYANEEK